MSHALRAAVLASIFLAGPAFAESLLTVTGRGSAVTTTSEARINGTADSKGATAAEALAAGRAVTANIAKALARLGVPENDFTITGMNLNAQYASGPILAGQPRVITGYNCNTNILVRVDHADRIADILQALVDAGVTQSARVTYVAHDTDDARVLARAAAVKDAFARGKILAGQTGVTLGPVVSVTDGPSSAGVLNYTEQLMSIMNTSLGVNHTVAAAVTVSWAIR
jgi:uncharacterized protein YggE